MSNYYSTVAINASVLRYTVNDFEGNRKKILSLILDETKANLRFAFLELQATRKFSSIKCFLAYTIFIPIER